MHHAGAAPARAVWKTAMRAATSMMLELVAEFGIAPNSPRLQRGANLSQLFSLKLVPPRGNAPRSIDYQSMALLLSYGGGKSPVKVTLPRVSDVSRAYYYYTNGRKVVTASGLSPDRTELRTRVREMLCICGVTAYGKMAEHQRIALWTVLRPQLFSRQCPRLCRTCSVKLAPRVGIAPTRLAAPD
jgi:hypothetical protein